MAGTGEIIDAKTVFSSNILENVSVLEQAPKPYGLLRLNFFTSRFARQSWIAKPSVSSWSRRWRQHHPFSRVWGKICDDRRTKENVWLYVDTNHHVGHPDRLKVFATPEAADDWFKENYPEGVAF
jgi:hypothetical protein